jgi:hypothetical protein
MNNKNQINREIVNKTYIPTSTNMSKQISSVNNLAKTCQECK